MPQKFILYWRDIPAQIIVKERRNAAKVELPKRFIEAIDACAMRVGAKDSDAYLEQWRKSDPEPLEGDLQELADAAAAQLEEEFPQSKLRVLIKNEGWSV